MTKTVSAEFEDLKPIPQSRLDTRSDADLVSSLLSYHPVTSERNVWAFWDKGFEAMPPWTQRNVLGWIRRLGSSWTVRVLDSVPESPNNVYRYTESSDFPAAFNERRLNGKGAGQHSADFVRLAVLYRYGGVYMDVSTILFRNLEDFCWSALENPSSPYEVAGFAFQCRKEWGQIINCFIASRKQNPFIYRLKLCRRISGHQVFLRLWEGRTDAVGIHRHPLVRHLGLLAADDPNFGDSPNWEGFTDYAAQILAYERVRLIREPGQDGFDGPAYFRKHFFLLDAWEELCRGQEKFDGLQILKLLLLPRHSVTNSEEDGSFIGKAAWDPDGSRLTDYGEIQKMARDFVHDLLANSCVCKFSQGFLEPGMPPGIAAYWSTPGLEDADSRPGTWGEYLRYGSVHLEPTGEERKHLKPLPIPQNIGEVHNVGLFEAVHCG
ncbi:hypothetical protein Plec18170_001948 [Paecilomyces lecythidis]